MTAGALAATVLEAVPVPVLILRAAGRIEFLNPTARRLLYRPGSWLQQGGDSVRRVGGLEAAALKALIREAQSVGAGSAVTTAGECRVILRFSSVAESPPFLHAWPQAAVLLTIDALAERDEQDWLRHVSRRYRLTPTERMVLQRLGAGETVESIASGQGVLPSTVRTHLAALFGKTGRHRQSDLVRLALGR